MNRKLIYGLIILLAAAGTAAVAALLINIQERKSEEHGRYFFKNVEIDETTVDPAVWGKNYPRQYDSYKKTVDQVRTRYGGSEAFSKLDEDPAWKIIFAGYAFGVEYREERGHAYSLEDQKLTLRTQQFKQPGACLQCHAGGMEQVYREAGAGDIQAGFAKVNAMPIQEAWDLTTGHPVACIDCHDPSTMELRVTRPGFINGIKELKKLEGIENFDPNTMSTRQEMRSFVCGQCHVEYYFKGEGKQLTYPWSKGLKVEEIEAYYEEDGHRDWTHAETGAKVLKAQHPEFELWNQGIHAKSGVTCVDCHMPYMREGAVKVTDHHIRSPLLNASRACLQCHHFSESEMIERAETIQERTNALLNRAEEAVVALIQDISAARKSGVPDEKLQPAFEMQRKAQWRLDFISAENSMGFHASQEAARILAESIDFARQGQLLVREISGPGPAVKEDAAA